MSNTTKLLLIAGLSHLVIIPAIIYGSWWMWLLSFVWWQFIAATSISAGYHRYFSHRSFLTGKWYEYYVQFLAIFANSGPVLTWASSHRMHHRYPDTEKDPHSPHVKGFFRVYFSLWGYGTVIEKKFLRDLLKIDSVMFFYKYYFKISITVAVILFLISPMLFVFAYCIPIVFAFNGYGLINAWTHRTLEVKNSFVANILTAGEGWHKNHHEEPWNWKIGKTPLQLDTGAWFIRIIKKDKNEQN